MKISIIVPLYNGEKYVNNIIKMARQNAGKLLKNGCLVELVFVKDSLEEYTIMTAVSEPNLTVCVLQNSSNRGIHYSRVRGVLHSTGEYICMLDQDDEVSDDFLLSQLTHLANADMIVANGIKEYDNYNKFLYRYKLMQYTVKYLWFYTHFSCRILSPGQCLIRRKSIPDIWLNNIIKNNGADDFFLWLLMFENKRIIKINPEKIYIHKNTNENLSLNDEKMKDSLKEVIKTSRSLNCINSKCLDIIEKNQLQNESGCKKFFLRIVNIVERINKKKG